MPSWLTIAVPLFIHPSICTRFNFDSAKRRYNEKFLRVGLSKTASVWET